MVNETSPEGFRNLGVVLAFSVLDQVLSEFIQQGLFSCKSTKFGARMDSSKSALQWQDYKLIDSGREKRNRLAHDGVLIDDAECLVFIEAIENELAAWKA